MASSSSDQPLTAEERRLCQTQACRIQRCLQHRNHNEIFCQAYIDDWKNCIERVRIQIQISANTTDDGSGNIVRDGGTNSSSAAVEEGG